MMRNLLLRNTSYGMFSAMVLAALLTRSLLVVSKITSANTSNINDIDTPGEGMVVSKRLLADESSSYDDRMYGPDLFQGDIEPTWDCIVRNYGIEVAEELVKEGKIERGIYHSARGTAPAEPLWNNDRKGGIALIPVYIDINYSAFTIKKIRRALFKLQFRSKVIQFQYLKKKPTSGRPFLTIQETPGRSCSSYVGRIKSISDSKEGQVISLKETNFACIYTFVIQHEMLHALGFHHEQSRPDRDDYVRIDWTNIDEKNHKNFAKANDVNSLGSKYDLKSIMHYTATTFAIDKTKPAIEVLNGGEIVRSESASNADIIQLRLMYQCKSGPRTLLQFSLDKCNEDCKCWKWATGCNGSDLACQSGLICQNNRCVSRPEGYPTLSPTPAPLPRKILETEYCCDGWTAGGIMFDVQALKNPINVHNFAIFTSAGSWDVEIYTKEGTSIGFHDKRYRWKKIGSARITTSSSTTTGFPENVMLPQTIQRFRKQAFYITTASTEDNVKPFRAPYAVKGYYSIWMQNWQVRVMSGTMFYGKFSDNYVWPNDGYGFFGSIEYSVGK